VKTQVRKIPRLLGEAKTYLITIDIGTAGIVEMRYQREAVARQDYERIRTQGTYAQHWIRSITYAEET
jgi:hypothetical protein